MRPAFLDALRAAVDRLEGCGVRYLLTGAVALQAYATPRLTFDADIAATFSSAAEMQCFEKVMMLEEEGRDMFGQATRIYHPPANPTFIEVFVATKEVPLRALGRRRRLRLEVIGRDVWMVAPEDLVVLKALQARQPDRPGHKAAQDRVDIAEVFRVMGPQLDRHLLRKEAAELGVTDDLAAWL